MVLSQLAPAGGGGGGGGDWSPTNLPNCVSWWVADNALTNTSGQVTQISDAWVNGFHLTNQATGKLPQMTNNAVNGHALVKFDGVDDFLRCYAFTNPLPIEIWLLVKVTDGQPPASQKYVYDSAKTTADRRPAFLLQSPGGGGGMEFYSGDYNALTISYLTNVWAVFTAVLDAGVGKSRIFTNGVLAVAGTSTGSTPWGLTMGVSRYGNGAANYSFLEMVTYSTTNDGAGMTMLKSNWNQKYALNLP